MKRFCVHGHDTFVVKRKKSNGMCLRCHYDYNKVWAKANRVYMRAWERRYYLRRKEYKLASLKRYYERNRAKRLEYVKAWQKRNSMGSVNWWALQARESV